MSRNHLSTPGVRATWALISAIASLVNLTPVSYTVVTNVTTGCKPFQVILAVKFITASTVSRSAPFRDFRECPNSVQLDCTCCGRVGSRPSARTARTGEQTRPGAAGIGCADYGFPDRYPS